MQEAGKTMAWKVGQVVELCAGPKADPDVLAERTIARVTKVYAVLSSGSKVRNNGTLIGRHHMFVRAKQAQGDDSSVKP